MEFRLDHAIPALDRTPAVLSALLESLPSGWLDAREGPEAWSPREIVNHLIHGERVDWIPRARIIIAQGRYRQFQPFDLVAELKSDRPLNDLIEELDQRRAANTATLTGWNLSERDIALTGGHPALGTVTMRQLLAT